MKRSLSLVLLVSLVLVQASCASKFFTGISSDYPEGWGRVSHSEDPESAIAGSYKNYGDCSYNPVSTQYSSKPSLGIFLGQVPFHIADDGAGIVTITRLRPGTLQVEVVTGGGAKHMRVLEASKDDFRVAEGAVWLKSQKRSYGDGTGYVWENDSLGLRKSDDGALVCEWRHGSAALALWIVPLKGSQIFWMRWWPEKILDK